MNGYHYTILFATIAAAVAAFTYVQGGWIALGTYTSILIGICGFSAA